jgi:Flp pilus assembly protein TadG
MLSRQKTLLSSPKRPNSTAKMFLALTHFWNNRRGTTAIITALCGPVVVGFLALAVDVGSWQVARLSLQGAADAAAYSAVVAYNNSVNNSVVRQAKGITAAYGYVDGQNGVTVSVNQPPTSGAHTSDVTAIEVIIQQAQKRYFSALFLSSNPTVTVRAVASPGTTGSCVVALDTSAQAAFT